MILCDSEILECIQKGEIVIRPFDKKCLGTNSYDVHLGNKLAVYTEPMLFCDRKNEVRYFEIPEEGFWLEPDEFYLGSTKEYTETHKHVPYIEGKSSIGRLGISIHETACKGDVGFCNHWTLEISCKKRTLVKAGMPIGQITYYNINSEKIINKYGDKYNSKYTDKTDIPVPSMMYKNF